MYAHYDDQFTKLCAHSLLQDPPLPRPWGVFTSIVINGGGRVVTKDHTDEHDQPGMCVIFPFGTYDHTESARLVCEDLGVDIEMPAGVPLLLPSALLRHRNTRIIGGQEVVRCSMVFWSAGGPFRWMDLGGKMVKNLTDDEKAARKARSSSRLGEILSWYPTERAPLPATAPADPKKELWDYYESE